MLIGLVFDPVIEIHVQPVIFLMEKPAVDIILRNNRRLDQLSVCFGRECIHLMRKLFLHPAMLHQPAAFLHTGRSHGKNDSADAKANDFLFCHYLISPFLFEIQK